MIESRIIVEKVIHSNIELEQYVPQINIGFGWKNILSKGSYILTKSYLKPGQIGTSVDQKELAQRIIDIEVKKLETLVKYL